MITLTRSLIIIGLVVPALVAAQSDGAFGTGAATTPVPIVEVPPGAFGIRATTPLPQPTATIPEGTFGTGIRASNTSHADTAATVSPTAIIHPPAAVSPAPASGGTGFSAPALPAVSPFSSWYTSIITAGFTPIAAPTGVAAPAARDGVATLGSFQSPGACSADAMQCADGSWVGRTGADCQFVCPLAAKPAAATSGAFTTGVSAMPPGGAAPADTAAFHPRRCGLAPKACPNGATINPGADCAYHLTCDEVGVSATTSVQDGGIVPPPIHLAPSMPLDVQQTGGFQVPTAQASGLASDGDAVRSETTGFGARVATFFAVVPQWIAAVFRAR